VTRTELNDVDLKYTYKRTLMIQARIELDSTRTAGLEIVAIHSLYSEGVLRLQKNGDRPKVSSALEVG
jgi:hypothetical protein